MTPYLIFFLGGVVGIIIGLSAWAMFDPPSKWHTYSKSCILSDLDGATFQVYCPINN